MKSEIGKEVVEIRDIKEGDFVLVSFVGGKRNTCKFVYLCCVQEVNTDEDEIRVMGFKSTNSDVRKSFVAQEDDVSIVNFSQIISVLPAPDVTMSERRLTYVFKSRIGVKEK